jgi:cyclic beta-1,2-glucan synthetase
MYRAAIESLLGLRRNGATISVNPCIPAVWPHYSIDWTVGRTRYHFSVTNPEHRSLGIVSSELNGVAVDARAIPFEDDGGTHEVKIVLGAGDGTALPSTASGLAEHRQASS